MGKVYIYYESKNNKVNESTTEVIEVFSDYKTAHKYMNKQRELYIKEYNLIPHHIDGNGDKSWCRLYHSEKENNYIDLIITEKSINN